jgi:ribulose-phosphate 3-epimerase
MTHSTEILPGILEHSWEAIEQKLLLSQSFASSVHIDIIDGEFVNNITFLDPAPFTPFSKKLTLELHMMVKNPIQYLQPFANAGFTRFLGHIEMMEDQREFIREAKQYGEAGLAIDGPTPLEKITVPFDSVDSFLIYTSERVGFSGPEFVPERLQKIRDLHTKTPALIEVDGGINANTLPLAREAGASRFAVTSFLFAHSDPQSQYIQLQNS